MFPWFKKGTYTKHLCKGTKLIEPPSEANLENVGVGFVVLKRFADMQAYGFSLVVGN